MSQASLDPKNIVISEIPASDKQEHTCYALTANGKPIRVLSDLPLYPTGAKANEVNYVLEILPTSHLKYEVEKHSEDQKIVRDRVLTVPVGPWYYGFCPQTYSDFNDPLPEKYAAHFKDIKGGDGDPTDMILLRDNIEEARSCGTGMVVGVLKLIDQGELDHKIIMVDPTCPKYGHCRSIEDVRSTDKTVLEYISHYYAVYKLIDKQTYNQYLSIEPDFSDKYADVDVALDILKMHHANYNKKPDMFGTK